MHGLDLVLYNGTVKCKYAIRKPILDLLFEVKKCGIITGNRNLDGLS